jgi:hypothetical protein
MSAQNWIQWQVRSRLTNVRPTGTWIVSVMLFYKHNITGLQNIIWQIYCQRKCLETVFTSKLAHSKPIFLCVLPSLVLLPCYSTVRLAYLMVWKQWRSTEFSSQLPNPLAIYVYTREAFRRVLTWLSCGLKLASPGLDELRLVCGGVYINAQVLVHWFAHYTA